MVADACRSMYAGSAPMSGPHCTTSYRCNKLIQYTSWGLPKDQAIQLLPQNTATGQTIRDFYQAVLAYYPAEASIEQALKVIESGLAFLREAASWASTT